ncbi:MAG: lysylphosphatidylglycerol synthase transmembrane domain-containing protein [Ktedonobacterales bacterium]
MASWLFALLAVAALIAVVVRFGELRRVVEMIGGAQPRWLLAALAFQLGTYLAVALGWNQVLRKAGSEQSLRRLMPIAVMKLFADQILPSAGMGGNVLLVDRLSALGSTRGTAVAALLVSMIGYYAVYAALALVMLLLLWMHDRATPVLAGIVTSFLLVALALPTLALWLRRRGSRMLPPWVERLTLVSNLLHIIGEAPRRLVADGRLIVSVAALNGLVFLCDAATLKVCLLSLGQHASYATALIALLSGSIATTLVPVPLGLGSFEASSTAMLTLLGIPLAVALAGTLLLRGFTLWLPLLPGLFLMRRSLRKSRGMSPTR